MRVSDDSLWHGLASDLMDTDHGKPFLDFVSEWMDRAEELVDRQSTDPADALRMTLDSVEKNLERKNVWIVGQALVVICMHWVYGKQASEGFTELEMRLVEDITAAKIAQLQAQAEGEDGSSE